MADVGVGGDDRGFMLFGTRIPAEAGGAGAAEEGEVGGARAKAAGEKRAAASAARLPCPRCDSAETKFCYFNNYNVNQPRHFCRGCQRYWTAGGALRNVPVGAGRRKARPPSRGDRRCAPEYSPAQPPGLVVERWRLIGRDLPRQEAQHRPRQ